MFGHRRSTEPDNSLARRVLYVMGVGRSGSTVLDTILGNHPEMESLGELYHSANQQWVATQYCACGSLVPECPFWSQVMLRWIEAVGAEATAEFEPLARRFELGRIWNPLVFHPGITRSPAFQRYARTSAEMLDAIRQVCCKPILVDSSKNAYRAAALARTPGVDLRAVHLVRDVRGVAWSMQKRLPSNGKDGLTGPSKPCRVWRAVLGWIAANLRCEAVARQLPGANSIRMRYEDFVVDPARELARIGDLVGADMEQVIDGIASGSEMAIGHTIAGNRMRLAGSVRLNPDVEWIDKMSPRDRWTCWLLAGPMLRRYGYRRKPDRPTSGAVVRPQERRLGAVESVCSTT